MAELAAVTGQDLYGLCRCLYRYPDVFDAYRELVIGRATEGTRKESFAARRERTRAQRIARYAK